MWANWSFIIHHELAASSWSVIYHELAAGGGSIVYHKLAACSWLLWIHYCCSVIHVKLTWLGWIQTNLKLLLTNRSFTDLIAFRSSCIIDHEVRACSGSVIHHKLTALSWSIVNCKLFWTSCIIHCKLIGASSIIHHELTTSPWPLINCKLLWPSWSVISHELASTV